MNKVKDLNYINMFQQLWRFVGAIQVYHMGVRRNNIKYISAGLSLFSPMFSAHPYSSKYQLIELYDRFDRALYPDDLLHFMTKTESISTSSNQSKGEGLDAQLEEVNKASKEWAVGAMTASQWLRIFRNHDNLLELRQNVLALLKVKDPQEEAANFRNRDTLVTEIKAWRMKLRSERYLCSPNTETSLTSVDGKTTLDESLLKLIEIGSENREKVFAGVLLEGKQRGDLDLKEVYVTKEERERKTAISNLTKPKILKKIKEILELLPNGSIKENLMVRYEKANKKVDATTKPTILALHNEVEQELRNVIDSTVEHVELNNDGDD